jgi:hypothetical protein
MGFWEAFFLLLIFVPLTLLWAMTLFDIFRRPGMSPVSRALWLVAVIVLPLFGTLAYVIAHGAEQGAPGVGGAAAGTGRWS